MKSGAVMCLFFHPGCFKRPQHVTSMDQIEILDTLTIDSLKEIQAAINKPWKKKVREKRSTKQCKKQKTAIDE